MASVDVQVNLQLSQRQLNAVTRQIQSSLGNLNAKNLTTIDRELNKGAKSAQSFGDAIGLSARRFAAYTSAVAVVGRLSSALARATRDAIKFEREFVKLAQVFGTSAKGLGSLNREISNLSQEFGINANVIARTSVVLAQSGLSARDTEKALKALAKTTLASTFEDIGKTAEGAVAILAQFETGVASLESQLGSINAVAKKFAVESGDIIEAVRRAGGAFNAAGGNLEEFIALFTSVRSTTRESAETIATGFRTIFGRIQRPRTIEYFRQLNIELTDGQGNFIGAFEAIKRLSQGLEQAGIRVGSLKFAEVVEQLGGIRQISRVIPLLTQFGKAQEALNVAQGGSASLTEDVIKAQETLAQAFARTQENFNSLIREFSQSDSFQTIVRLALNLANAFINITKALKPLLPLIATFAGFKLGRLAIGAGKKAFAADSVINVNSGGKIHAFARGGLVPGSGNRDTVPAMLSPGEFVIRKSAVEAFGADRLAGINKYASGGTVSASNLTKGKKSIDTVYDTKENEDLVTFKIEKKPMEGYYDTAREQAFKIFDDAIKSHPDDGDAFLKQINNITYNGENISSFKSGRDTAASIFGKNGSYDTFKNTLNKESIALNKTTGAIAEIDVYKKIGGSKLENREGADFQLSDTHFAEVKTLVEAGSKDTDYVLAAKAALAYAFNSQEKPYYKNDKYEDIPGDFASAKSLQLDYYNFYKKYSTGGSVQKFADGGRPQVRDAVQRYSSNSAEINTGESSPQIDRIRNELDAIQDDIPKLVFSGIGQTRKKIIEEQIGGPIGPDKIGETFSLPGFLSTSESTAIAGKFVNKSTGGKGGIGYILYITTKGKGIKVSDDEAAHYEKESILPRNSKFKIDGTGLSTHGIRVDVQQLAKGGSVGTDTVPALLTPGEFVINKKSAQSYGYNNLEKINKYAKGGAVVQKFADGGGVNGFDGRIFNDILLELKKIYSALTNIEQGSFANDNNEAVAQQEELTEAQKKAQKTVSESTKTFSDLQKETSRWGAILGGTVGSLTLLTALSDNAAIKDFNKLLGLTTANFVIFNKTLQTSQVIGEKFRSGILNVASKIKDRFKKGGDKSVGGGLAKIATDVIKSTSKTEKTQETQVSTLQAIINEAQIIVQNGTIDISKLIESLKNEISTVLRFAAKTGIGQNIAGKLGLSTKALPFNNGLSRPAQFVKPRGPAGLLPGPPGRTGAPASPVIDVKPINQSIKKTGQRFSGLRGKMTGFGKGLRTVTTRGFGALIKGIGGAVKGLGSIATIGTQAVGLFASALAAVATLQAETAEKEKQLAIEQGEEARAVAALQKQTASEFKSQATVAGASIGGAVGTVVGSIFGPAGAAIGGLIGSVTGLIIGFNLTKDVLYLAADVTRAFAGGLLDGVNNIIKGINDYLLSPLAYAANKIYGFFGGEELDLKLEIPQVGGELASLLINAIPDPELADQLAEAEVRAAAQLNNYAILQEKANAQVKSSIDAFKAAGDAASRMDALRDALAATTSQVDKGVGGGELISAEDIKKQKESLLQLQKAQSEAADRTAYAADGTIDTTAINQQNRDIAKLSKKIEQSEKAFDAQIEATQKSAENFASVFEAARGAGLLADTIKEVNNAQKLQVDQQGIITRQSIQNGSQLDTQLKARIASYKDTATAQEKEQRALRELTLEIYGTKGALGLFQDSLNKVYQGIGSELKSLAFGSPEEQEKTAQKVLASASVATGQVKLNDLSQDVKSSVIDFLPQLANAGLTEFAGGNILDSLKQNVASEIPGFSQLDDKQQTELTKAMFGIDTTAQEQLKAAQESVALQTKSNALLEEQVRLSGSDPNVVYQEQGIIQESQEPQNTEDKTKDAFKKAVSGEFQLKTPSSGGTQDPQVSILNESMKQTVLLAGIYDGIGNIGGGDKLLTGSNNSDAELSDIQKRNKQLYGQANSAGFSANKPNVTSILASIPAFDPTVLEQSFFAFDNSISKLSEILQNSSIPETITLDMGNPTVNVNLNGAELLATLMPNMERLVRTSISDELINYEKIKDNNSSAGSYASSKIAERYNT